MRQEHDGVPSSGPRRRQTEQLDAWLTGMAEAGSADTIRQSLRRTIIPMDHGDERNKRRALELFGRMLQDVVGTGNRLNMGATIGQGGMGIVRLAEQASLARKVAVKSLRSDKKSENATMELLREAWVAGSLEHPNVVPVYDIDMDADGSPLIVLKRIEGVTWRELMSDYRTVNARFAATDLLEWNLGILLQVVNAARFAHSRGIIHRDLKPDNVMIGEFGEVYLLDWGIAVSLRDDGAGRLPLAREAVEMAGTPGYMAPEMLGGAPSRLSPRTDIYLIGSIIYECLAGHPPHRGDSAAAIIDSVLRSSPSLPEDAPAELAAICRRAMDPDPAGRFETCEQLRLALSGFLQHRGSNNLTQQAEQLLVEIEELILHTITFEERHQRIYDLFGACRFGFREALSAWPGNARARAGFERALEHMIDYEIGQGNPAAARALLTELSAPPEALKERVAQALAQRTRDRQRLVALERLGRDMDFAVGQRTRSFLAGVLGLVFTVTPIITVSIYGREMFETYPRMLYGSGVFLFFVAALGWWARDSLGKSAINRRLFGSLVFMLVAQIVLQGSLWTIDVPPSTALRMQMFCWFYVSAMLTITVDGRLWLATLAYLASFFIGLRVGDSRYFCITAANAVLTINAVWIWWPRRGSPSDAAQPT